jgi:hypothetical protein
VPTWLYGPRAETLIYAQNTRHGFSVIDFGTRVQTNFINLPDIPAAQQCPFGGVSHGMAITSDQKTLVINSSKNSTLYAYSLPDLNLLGGAAHGGKGANWSSLRGILRGFGLKVGKTTPVGFEGRIRELVAGHPWRSLHLRCFLYARCSGVSLVSSRSVSGRSRAPIRGHGC